MNQAIDFSLPYREYHTTRASGALRNLSSILKLGAVGILAAIARSAKFKVGQPIKVSAEEAMVMVRAIGMPKLPLFKKLTAFDPVLHGGETMSTVAVGSEDSSSGKVILLP